MCGYNQTSLQFVLIGYTKTKIQYFVFIIFASNYFIILYYLFVKLMIVCTAVTKQTLESHMEIIYTSSRVHTKYIGN